MDFDTVKKLFEEKRKTVVSEIDLEKVEVIDELFQNPQIFFHLDYHTSLAILKFIGIPEDEVKAAFFDLISFKNWAKGQEKPYILVDPEWFPNIKKPDE